MSGIVDAFEDTTSIPVSEVQKTVEVRAIERAIAAGADPQCVTVVESKAIPIAYTTGRCRFYVKAAGEWSGIPISDPIQPSDDDGDDESSEPRSSSGKEEASNSVHRITPCPSLDAAEDVLGYVPHVRGQQWFLSQIDLAWIADGCYVLGCGGGGSPLHTFLELREMVRAGAAVRVVDRAALPPDALVGWGGGMGSPEVSAERLLGNE